MKALTIGGAMIDTIAVIADDHIERMVMRNAETSFLLLEEGRKNEAEDISTHCGGGAVNAAVAMARLGLDVSTLIKLGQDTRAETILARLTAEGISTRFVMRDARAPTGASVLIAAHDRNAAIFTARGANTLLQVADLKPQAFMSELVYVSSLSNKSADCFPQIVENAKAEGAFVAVNPGIRQLSAKQAQFRDVIGNIDLLAVNAHEASALVPWLTTLGGEGGSPLSTDPSEVLPDLARRGFSTGGFVMALRNFCRNLHQLGPQWIVITDGRDGAYVSSPTAIVHCPAITVSAAGTAGAGDAFSATLAAYLARSEPVTTSVLAASLNAASVIAHLDTQTGLLRRDELETRIAAQAPKIKIRQWKN